MDFQSNQSGQSGIHSSGVSGRFHMNSGRDPPLKHILPPVNSSQTAGSFIVAGAAETFRITR